MENNELPRACCVVADNRLAHSAHKVSLENGGPGEPAIGFEAEPTIGWYLNDNNEFILTAGLDDITVQNMQGTEFKKPITIHDSIPDEPAPQNKGVLYKKPNDSGLWWRTADVDIDLTAIDRINAVPLFVTQQESQPTDLQPTEPQPTDYTAIHGTELHIANDLLTVDKRGVLLNKLYVDGSCITQESGDLSLRAPSGYIKAPYGLKFLDGTLFTKQSSLYWQTPYGEINLTDVSLPSMLHLPSNEAEPPYSFAANTKSGMSMLNGSLVHMVNGKVLTKLDDSTFHLNGSLALDDAAGKIVLYKKGDDLFASMPSGMEINITHPQVQEPPSQVIVLPSPALPIPALSKLELSHLDQTGALYHEAGQLIWSVNGITHNLLQPVPSMPIQPIIPSQVPALYKLELSHLNQTGALYHEAGQLIWSVNGITHNLLQPQSGQEPQPDVFQADGINDFSIPDFSFKNDTSTGLSRVADGVVGLVSMGQLTVAAAVDQVMMYKPIALYDTDLSIPSAAEEGRLYKRTGSNALIWSTIDGELDLTSPIYPLRAPDGLSYSFDSEFGIGKYDDTLTLHAGAAHLSINTQGARLGCAGRSGLLSIHNNDLYWNDKNLCSAAYPLNAPDGSLWQPSYSFSSDSTMGITRAGGSIVLTNNGSIMAQFFANKTCIPAVETAEINLPHGRLINIDGKLLWRSDGDDYILNEPAMRTANYKIEQTLNDLDIKLDGVTVAKFANTGMTAPALSILDGLLKKVGDHLVWQTASHSVTLSDKSIAFPIMAPSGAAAYGFADTPAGIELLDGKLVMRSLDSQASIDSQGLTVACVNTMQINVNKIQSDPELKIIADKIETTGIFRGKQTGVTFGYDLLDYSVGISQSNGGLGLVSGKTSCVTVTDASLNVKHRNVAFLDAILERKGADLYWTVGSKETQLNKPHEKWYKSTLTYTALHNIKQGDAICMDPNGTGRICKGIGGQTRVLEKLNAWSGNCKTMTVFDYDAYYAVLCFTKVKLISNKTAIVAVFVQIHKNTGAYGKMYEAVLTMSEYTTEGVLEDGYGKVLQLDTNTYLVPYLKPGDQIVQVAKITNVFSMSPQLVKLSLDMSQPCESLAADYDLNSQSLVLAVKTPDNIAIALVSGQSFTAGTLEFSISNMPIFDSGKQIHLVVIPGGTCVVSYGIVKVVFIMASYQGTITHGDSFMDYECVDCAGMYYDGGYGVILSLEKTVSGSCYIQVLDVLGISIQKIASRGFHNANVEPLGLSYNSISGSYAILYASGSGGVPVYVQTFDFDGEVIHHGLRFQSPAGLYEPSSLQHGCHLFELPGTGLFIYGHDAESLAIFEPGFRGYPSGYLGVAQETVDAGMECAVAIKGHIYHGAVALSNAWLGKKLYITDSTKDYPEYLSSSAANGVFYGTCLDPYRILLGL